MGTKRSRSRHVIAAMLAVGSLIAVSGAPVGAAVSDNKTYTVESTTESVFAGDTDATITIKIKNTSESQSLGSANLTVPAPFSLVSAAADAVPGGPVVQLRNLNLAPGAFTTVTLTVDVRTCSDTTGVFEVTAKQSNDYNGNPGNDFYLAASPDRSVYVSGPCKLGFVAQPADAERDATITSVDYNPEAAAVSVGVFDAGSTGRIGASTPLDSASATVDLALSADPDGTSLVGTKSAPLNDGLATFAPKVLVSAFGYSLTATSPGFGAAPNSNTFDIVDEHVACGAGGDCPATAPVSKNGVSVTTDFGPGVDAANLLVSVGAGDAPSFDCGPAYPRNEKPVSQFVFKPIAGGEPTLDFAGDRKGTFTMSFPDASRPLNSYEVCWAAPYQFQKDGGGLTEESDTLKPGTDNQKLHVGLLPDCKRGTPLPCIASRSFKKATAAVPATVTIVVNADGRDPWRY